MLLLLFLHQVTPRLASAVVVFKSNLNTFIKLSTPNLWDCGWRTVCCCDILCKLCEYVFKWIFWSCFISIIKYLDYDMWYIHKIYHISYLLKNYSVHFVCLIVFIKRGCAEKAEKGESGEEVKIVAVDLQAMAPLPGVTQIQGDITKVGT